MIELIRNTKKKEPLIVELSTKIENLELKVESVTELANGLVDIIADDIVDMDGDK